MLDGATVPHVSVRRRGIRTGKG